MQRQAPGRLPLAPGQQLVAALLISALHLIAGGVLVAGDLGVRGPAAAAVKQSAAERALTRWREGSCGCVS